MDRRFFLRGLGVLGCSAAAHPLLSTVTFAGSDGRAPLGDRRLIVVILRGAMDGLDAVQPLADPLFAGLRPTLGVNTGAADLDGYFALHPALGGLLPLWKAGELAFVHATSTPYREVRSHFDGQDMLEAGTGNDVPPSSVRDGWLNRMLQGVPGLTSETAYAVGIEALPLLAGPAPVRNWVPDLRLQLSAQSRLLLEQVYHEDPLFRDAALEAFDLTDELGVARMAEPVRKVKGAVPEMVGDGSDAVLRAAREARLGDIDKLVDFAAGRLQGETRIASFSLSGWDSHNAQRVGLPKNLLRLERTILRLREQLGPEVWGKTTLLAMTEFGRTVRENGTGGTDHGTGGAMVVAGGAVRGGKVYGRWPGLADADQFEGRDLMPTSDVRYWAGWAMAGLYGLDRGLLERTIFPGLDLGSDPRLIL